MPSEYAKTLGARLRAIRMQQGLSLHGVEEKSRGRWKAVVIGSYERGDRSVTVQKLAELAEFYGVPISEFLPGDASLAAIPLSPRLVINLERMTQLPAGRADALVHYVTTIQRQRNDYNGRVLTLRYEDLRALIVLYDTSPNELTNELIGWGVLDSEALGRAVEA
jgi:transcriptional regulator with XRE-family HTH domain